MLCTLKFYNDMCQLFLNKTGNKIKYTKIDYKKILAVDIFQVFTKINILYY